ncbi:hypothetical protein GYB22_03375 [bacterium]|nr:hypothetical protein [bacterium]
MSEIDKKLTKLYDFLEENRKYNHQVQYNYYKAYIGAYSEPIERTLHLLYHVTNTQSQPRIQNVAKFYRKILGQGGSLDSMQEFILTLNPNEEIFNLTTLFKNMTSEDSWGPKTSSLFVKSVYQLHCGSYPKEFEFWQDVPQQLSDENQLYLPVDTVIIELFERITNGAISDFYSINEVITSCSQNGVEVWDDLWFWGYINQKGSGKNRSLEWNLDKYWANQFTDKDPATINEIELLSKQFRSIILGNG